ncbi:MAG: hypothetical protein CM1200mP2_37870 [Planctomycetaceae bacterium]|nr:MAG: hypothetical protein CM1200mP2_37870 [Planctomycetaceae bacterium]
MAFLQGCQDESVYGIPHTPGIFRSQSVGNRVASRGPERPEPPLLVGEIVQVDVAQFPGPRRVLAGASGSFVDPGANTSFLGGRQLGSFGRHAVGGQHTPQPAALRGVETHHRPVVAPGEHAAARREIEAGLGLGSRMATGAASLEDRQDSLFERRCLRGGRRLLVRSDRGTAALEGGCEGGEECQSRHRGADWRASNRRRVGLRGRPPSLAQRAAAGRRRAARCGLWHRWRDHLASGS